MSALHQASPAYDAIAQRAAGYLERRRFESWNKADQAELDAWLAESALNEVAYLRLESAVAFAKELVALRPSAPSRNAPPREDDRIPRHRFLLRCFAASADHAQTRRSHLRRRVVLPLLAAASVALIAALGFPLANALLQPPPDHTYSTEVGGRTLLSFADHTQIELNTDTVMRYRMTTRERTVWLEKGEAWFRVAHDAAHPFTVIVGRHRVSDLGTEFLVRRDADALEVTLVNGRAALSTEGAQTAMLAPGDDAVATPVSMTVARKSPQELADELAWQRGMLVFRKTRLADVVHQFNRYNRTRLVIADPSIADQPFSAELKTDDYEDFLSLAQTLLSLRIERDGNEILISRGPREKTRRAVHARHG